MKHAKGSPFSSDYQSQADWSPNTKARPPHQGGWGNGPHLKAIDKGRGSIGYLGCFDHVKAAQIKKPSQI
ncbi:hypothetical protein M8A51_25620 [Schlegelella sp. S2-27]|uniref:Uncharacterized protein n=1 Tax=Caldimonas mangrovi TaxID=2944811 RepID=A0ABT0YVY4_9BURK|nr:hypothetical protein [Caldimonas mangrovi]MCM5682916.1 hypothetical protein [Caldimonas mangrovi]